MIKIDKEKVLGFEQAIRGMRNPLNSWDKSDTTFNQDELGSNEDQFVIGDNDFNLMKKLALAGTDHGKFMRMITVYVDINAPLYWWKEFDQYKVGTVTNSCSTMHKIHSKEFTLEDFSYEHLLELPTNIGDYSTIYNYPGVITYIVNALNHAREMYLETKDKKYWWQMIQLLPSSYNQKRTVMMNYAVLKNIYNARKNHKLDE